MNNSIEIKRHSLEHVMVLAIQNIFGSEIKLGVGPVIENGFYQDIDFGEIKITEADFEKIEKEMKKIIDSKLAITREEIDIDEAIKFFEEKKQTFKVELLKDIKEKGSTKMKDEAEIATVANLTDHGKVSMYTIETHRDLCRGPHVENTSELENIAFKLDRIAGAYWRGNEKNPMLTRIYAVAFETENEIVEYYKNIEEIKKRDHRVLGEKLDLFAFSDMVGPGLVLWKPKGTIIRDEIENWAKEVEKKAGYVRVSTPHIAKHTLYETSGHLPYYRDDMYSPMMIDDEEYFLKGMNCPHHHMIFKSTPKSYKNLPLRYAEYGMVYRFEQSGSLFGLMRVRSICQNDAHIYCTLEQAENEFYDVLKLHELYYNALGLTRDDYHIVIGLPDPKKSDKYHGDASLWAKSLEIMKKATDRSGIRFVEDIGGAAFYGPKIDFNIRSSVGREFAISTVQLDLFMPIRFNLEFTNRNNEKELCAVIHRAPLGSHERFIGFLIEHFAGNFPLWMSPVQVTIVPISNDKHLKYANEINEIFKNAGIRSEVDDASETMNNKIRLANEQKVNYIVVVGDREEKDGTVSVRGRGGKNFGVISNLGFVEKLISENSSRSLNSAFEEK